MQTKSLFKKGLAVGIILAFVTTIFIPNALNATPVNFSGKNFDKKECTMFRGNITVTFTYPEKGIYWNDRKIMPFRVPLILHGMGSLGIDHLRLYRRTPVNFTIEGPVIKLAYYWDGVLIGNVTVPPWTIGSVPMTSFSHVTIKIVAYGYQGDSGSDEITIYRLFL